VLYPQNGDRIVTIDSVTSLHPVYSEGRLEWVRRRHLADTIERVVHGGYAALRPITLTTCFTGMMHVALDRMNK